MNFAFRESNHYKKRIISPPVTPKQKADTWFVKSTLMDHYNAAALPLSPPPFSVSSHYYKNCHRHRKRESSCDSSCSSHSAAFYQSRRKQINPTRSPSSTTKGTFLMPLDLLAKTSSSIEKDRATTSKSNEQTKRKRGNGCITHIEELEHEEEQEKKKKRKNSNSLSLSSMLLLSSSLPSKQSPFKATPEQVEIMEKSGTRVAHTYDNLSADCDQAALFLGSEEWIPSLEVFNRKPAIRVSWKGSSLKIKTMPYFDKLHPSEVTIAATLRLTPEQYLKCKWALILAAKEASETDTLFRKSEAQKVCCVDVNKTSVLWTAFGKLGWLGPRWPQ